MIPKLKLHLAPAGRRGFGLQAEVFFFFEPLARYMAAWRPPPRPGLQVSFSNGARASWGGD